MMKKRVRNWFLVSLLIAGFLSLFASTSPDGFEKAGEEVGYIEHATSYMPSLLPDYTFPGTESWIFSTISGLLGVAITYGAFVLMGKWIVGRRRQ